MPPSILHNDAGQKYFSYDSSYDSSTVTGGGRFNPDGSPSGRPIQETGEVKTQTREEWSASIGDDSISVGPTDTTSNKDEDDLFYGGKGFSSRTKGANPYLKIKKKSKGAKGKFTRGSLRVKKPKRMAV